MNKEIDPLMQAMLSNPNLADIVNPERADYLELSALPDDGAPEPFTYEQPATAWPNDCLPIGLQAAVDCIASHVQAPQALAGMAVLSAVAHITQRLVDVERPTGGAMPTSLFVLSLAGSGERKSECFRLATYPVSKDEIKARTQHQSDVDQTGEENRRAKKAAPKGEAAQVIDLPADPRTLFSDTTMEGIAKAFVMDSQPALTLATDEGGQFFGGHSMQSETRANSCGMLTKLFDGGGVDRQRASAESGSGFRAGVRFGVFLSAQPIVVHDSLSDPFLQGQGLLPRFLLSAPESLVGTRFVTTDKLSAKVTNDPAIVRYWSTLSRLNQSSIALDDSKQLDPQCYAVTGEPLNMWIAFYNEIESSNSRYLATTAFLSRAGELVRRVAAVLACYRAFDSSELNGIYSCHSIDKGNISTDDMRGAIALVRYSLKEWEQQFSRSSVSLSPVEKDACELLQWLQKKGDGWQSFTRGKLGQFAPNKLKTNTDRRNAAIDELIGRRWINDDGKKLILFCPPSVSVSSVSSVLPAAIPTFSPKTEAQTEETERTETEAPPKEKIKPPDEAIKAKVIVPQSQSNDDWLAELDAAEEF